MTEVEKAVAVNTNHIEHAAEKFLKDFFAYHRGLMDDNVIQEIGNEQVERIRQIGIPEEGRPLDTVMQEMEDDVYRYGYNVNHVRYFGFVPGPSSLLSWVGDIMTAAYNRHAGTWATCPAGGCIEEELIAWLCDKAGYPSETSGGLFVSGGSMANMTALTVARDQILSEDTWHLGTAYVSEQTHSSVAKGLRMIGIGNSRIRKIPVDDAFRMDTEQLEHAIQRDREAGFIPFVVIASAGTTNTGSIDPFEKISAICRQNGMWMHVDGAYGASVLLSPQHRDLLKGIELSDSISWDAHKWLFQTYACGMVLVKEKRNMMDSFGAHPEYLKDLEAEHTEINPSDMGMELTRPARGLKLWLTLQVMGSKAFGEAIDHGFVLAQWAEDELKTCEDVEMISPAHMAMVNFRYNPQGYTEKQKDALNQQISRKMVQSGYAGVFTTELKGKKVLRICSIHPETTEKDIRTTVQRLHQYYYEMVGDKGGI